MIAWPLVNLADDVRRREVAIDDGLRDALALAFPDTEQPGHLFFAEHAGQVVEGGGSSMPAKEQFVRWLRRTASALGS